MPDLPYAFAGLVVGLLVGATGIGGGALMTPLLVMFFGINPAVAIGTDLLFAALTKVAGVGVLGVRGGVDWQIVRRLLAGSLPGAFLATVFIYRLEQTSRDADQLLKVGIGFMLVVTATMMFLKAHLVRGPEGATPATAHRKRPHDLTLTVGIGALIGVIVASTSIGAGVLGTMALVLLYPGRWTPQRLVGTDLAHAIPLAVVAGAGYWAAGSLNFGLLGSLLAGSVPGVILGAMFASRAPVGLLRVLIAGALFLSGVKLLASHF